MPFTMNGNLRVEDWIRDRDLWGSTSQLDTADTCLRKWWFKSVLRLKEPIKGSRTFGTVYHNVVERYLRADDLGYDGSGKPVNLFPDGWHIVTERDGTVDSVNPDEANRIRMLVEKAIEAGLLTRTSPRWVEWHFKDFPVVPGMKLTGKVDLLDPSGITDHKTVKQMRYAKSPNALRKDLQVMSYANVAREFLQHQGFAFPERFRLRHVSACKDPKDIRVRESPALVTGDEVSTFWTSRVIPLATRMLEVRQIDEASQIPDPPDTAHACNQYGGCAFMAICQGRETASDYKIRLDRWEEAKVYSPDNSEKRAPALPAPSSTIYPGGPMSLPAAFAGPAAQLPQQAPQQPAPFPPPPPAPAPSQQAIAPWYANGCTACSDSQVKGFATNGQPCRICDSVNSNQQRPSSAAFDIRITPTELAWAPKAQYAQVLEGWAAHFPGPITGTVAIQGNAPVAESRPDAAPPAMPPPQPAPPAAQPPAPQPPPPQGSQVPPPQSAPPPNGAAPWQQPQALHAPAMTQTQQIQVAAALPSAPPQSPTAESATASADYEVFASQALEAAGAKSAKAGRPTKTFDLFIGCAPLDRKVLMLRQVYARVIGAHAKARNADTFHSLPETERRGFLAKTAAALADAWKKETIVATFAPMSDPDWTYFVQEVQGYTSSVTTALPVT